MREDYEEEGEVPTFAPPNLTQRGVLKLLELSGELHYDQVAAKLGLTGYQVQIALGALKRGGWVGTRRYKPPGNTLLVSVFYAREATPQPTLEAGERPIP